MERTLARAPVGTMMLVGAVLIGLFALSSSSYCAEPPPKLVASIAIMDGTSPLLLACTLELKDGRAPVPGDIATDASRLVVASKDGRRVEIPVRLNGVEQRYRVLGHLLTKDHPYTFNVPLDDLLRTHDLVDGEFEICWQVGDDLKSNTVTVRMQPIELSVAVVKGDFPFRLAFTLTNHSKHPFLTSRPGDQTSIVAIRSAEGTEMDSRHSIVDYIWGKQPVVGPGQTKTWIVTLDDCLEATRTRPSVSYTVSWRVRGIDEHTGDRYFYGPSISILMWVRDESGNPIPPPLPPPVQPAPK